MLPPGAELMGDITDRVWPVAVTAAELEVGGDDFLEAVEHGSPPLFDGRQFDAASFALPVGIAQLRHGSPCILRSAW